ncbi:uncharacterized protein LOC144704817 isoform X2 [Wolffia australiana]
MGDVSLVKHLWQWLLLRKQNSLGFLLGHQWPLIFRGCRKIGNFLKMMLEQWRGCVARGLRSVVALGTVVIFVILWSSFLYWTSIVCSASALIVLGIVQYLGHASGIFVIVLFGLLTVWIYGYLWVAGMLFIAGSYLLCLSRARALVLFISVYCVYSVYTRAGWIGIFLTANLAALSNDLLVGFLQGYEQASKATLDEETKAQDPPVTEDSDIPSQSDGANSAKPCIKPCVKDAIKEKTCSPINLAKSELGPQEEMKRIMRSLNHYETLCVFQTPAAIDLTTLKKEYRRKAVLVHPDKNMGNSLACESFKKLQTAYEVLADPEKRRVYDEQLWKERFENGFETPRSSSHQGTEYQSEESRRIECTKCGNIHIWICTNRIKSRARWCQDCCQYHPASNGDGWVELGSSPFDSGHGKVEIPRAFVCAESKIFDVSEWAICQGMACRPNTHRPTFQVSMVGPMGLDAEMVSEEEEEFELWFQEALAAGLFSEPPRRRKSWSPFKIAPKGTLLRHIRRFS